MIYDYIIIGGGFAGLISYKKLKEINPKYKILILEKNNDIGGRMNSELFYGVPVNIGAGIGRKHKDHLLINLLNELKIKYVESTFDVKYICKRINIQDCISRLYNNYNNQTGTFKEYGISVLGAKKYKNLVTNLGFSDFNNTDIYDVLHSYGLEDNYTNFKSIYIPWHELIEKLRNNDIKFNQNVQKIKFNETFYTVTCSTDFLCKKIIIATTIDTVKKLLPKQEIYKQIHGQPFLRAYGKFNKASNLIIKEIINKYTIVDSPLQKIIPINIENGIYMIAYCDNENAKKLKHNTVNNSSNRELFANEVKKALNIKTDLKLIGIRCYYWNIGTHYNSPLTNYKNRDKFLEKARNPQENIHVVGEVVSKNQGWSNFILDEFDFL
jgi:hypothetical protein